MTENEQPRDVTRIMKSPELQNLGFDTGKAIENLEALHQLSGLDAALFIPAQTDEDNKDVTFLYTTEGCARYCPRCRSRFRESRWPALCDLRFELARAGRPRV